MEAGYGEDENLGALLRWIVFKDFNHYVLDDANVALQKTC